MSEANKALSRRFIEELWNKNNVSVVDELVAANYVAHVSSGPDFGAGPDGVRKMHSYYASAFPDTRFTIDQLIAEGDLVVARWTARGTHRGHFQDIAPSGNKVAVAGTTVVRIANGKLVEAWETFDALGLLQQIGAIGRARGA